MVEGASSLQPWRGWLWTDSRIIYCSDLSFRLGGFLSSSCRTFTPLILGGCSWSSPWQQWTWKKRLAIFFKCVFLKDLQRWNQGTCVHKAASWMLIPFSGEEKMQMLALLCPAAPPYRRLNFIMIPPESLDFKSRNNSSGRIWHLNRETSAFSLIVFEHWDSFYCL